ncbi:hypothetical protein [Sediminitomix flava]|uniref:Uncharacterized protein n=1 Tax=Sediminitomix flava TaxID=379075 RepID=A0A315Z9C8_SEDFL|nr:hypothetical protein [Sediminitomix flava]PWJ41799.1 hypothetical protein BC781_10349 [Sediminitomix flava]
MNYIKNSLLSIFFLVNITTLSAQHFEVVSNYKGWKWDSIYVYKNPYISLAVVPDAAGRVLEYNLGETASLWINPKELGKSYDNGDEVKLHEWRNFGGYRLVPIPMNNWAINTAGSKVERWPPPVAIGDAPYQVAISEDKQGKEVLEVHSKVQQMPVPLWNGREKAFSQPNSVDEEIQYSRTLSTEENSSRVFYTHTLKNVGEKEIDRGIMTTSQHMSWTDSLLQDGENFVAYIPFSTKYKMPDGEQFHINVTPEMHWRYVHRNRMPLDKNNPEHVEKYFNVGTNWTGEVAPGIFEIHFDYNIMGGFHMVSSESWLCYVNKTNLTAFVKMFAPYDPTLTYEEGVNIAIYNSGMETGYLETEVKTPIYKLKSGEHFDFEEIHAAAKILSTPVLAVKNAGIVTEYLTFDEKQSALKGKYGVFFKGKAILKLWGDSSEVLKTIELSEVDPLHGFELNHEIQQELIGQVSKVEIRIQSVNQEDFLLDTLDLTNL